jgi:hypothetical protein
MISFCLYLLINFEWLERQSKIYIYQYQDNDTFVVIKFVNFFFKFVFQLGAVVVVIVW